MTIPFIKNENNSIQENSRKFDFILFMICIIQYILGVAQFVVISQTTFFDSTYDNLMHIISYKPYYIFLIICFGLLLGFKKTLVPLGILIFAFSGVINKYVMLTLLVFIILCLIPKISKKIMLILSIIPILLLSWDAYDRMSEYIEIKNTSYMWKNYCSFFPSENLAEIHIYTAYTAFITISLAFILIALSYCLNINLSKAKLPIIGLDLEDKLFNKIKKLFKKS